jgi:LmbE family N-acetylglucosaminyl deacetylase
VWNMRILAIGCHPDDVEINCAGTLAKYKKNGHDVVICHVANGNKGHMEIPTDELREIRKKEAMNAGAIIGAETISLDLGDGEVYAENKTTRDKVVDVIRFAKPDVIITHSPKDYMADHEAVSKLTFDASFMSTVPYYSTRNTYHSIMTPIYYMETMAGIGFQPEEYVDITDTIETKLEMLRQHISQITWLQDHDHIDMIEFAKTISKFRGLQCGVPFAEGFRQCRVYPKIQTKRMLP